MLDLYDRAAIHIQCTGTQQAHHSHIHSDAVFAAAAIIVSSYTYIYTKKIKLHLKKIFKKKNEMKYKHVRTLNAKD